MSAQTDEPQGRELDRTVWDDWFEDLDEQIEAAGDIDVTIEILGDLVGGTEVERLPLDSITYEDGDDQIAIGVGGRGDRYPAALWHYVEQPRRVLVREEGDEAEELTIVSQDGTRTLVRLHRGGG
jgi:hypothetical protein